MPQEEYKEEPIVIIEDKGYSVLRDDGVGGPPRTTQPSSNLHPLTWGRESDGTPSYPYITGWLQGSIQNAIRQLKSPAYSAEEVIDDLQLSFDQAEAWCEPYDSPKTEEEE